MDDKHITYRKGYKYQLVETYQIQTDLFGYEIDTVYIALTKNGLLTIRVGYTWDGCSGPTIDDETNMRGGLVHDAFYQLLREGLLPSEYRHLADHLLKQICLEDGMNPIRAAYYFEGVEHFGSSAAQKGNNPYPILVAP